MSLTCEELSNQLKNMLFFNNRNLRVAEIMTEITQSSKQFEEKSKIFTALLWLYVYKSSILGTMIDVLRKYIYNMYIVMLVHYSLDSRPDYCNIIISVIYNNFQYFFRSFPLCFLKKLLEKSKIKYCKVSTIIHFRSKNVIQQQFFNK